MNVRTGSRLAVIWMAASAMAVSTMAAAQPVAGQGTVNADDVRALLAVSQIENIISSLDELYLEHLMSMGLAPAADTVPGLGTAIKSAFSDSLIYRDVMAFLMDQDAGAQAAAARSVFENGPMETLHGLPDPEVSLEEFVAGLADARPPIERIRLMAQWAELQSAGAFYVLLDQAARESVHALARDLGAVDVPFEPLSKEEFQDAFRRNMNGAVISFLWRYQAADDGLLQEGLNAMATESGQWWVEQYTLAVAEAVRRAGGRVLNRLDDADWS